MALQLRHSKPTQAVAPLSMRGYSRSPCASPRRYILSGCGAKLKEVNRDDNSTSSLPCNLQFTKEAVSSDESEIAFQESSTNSEKSSDGSPIEYETYTCLGFTQAMNWQHQLLLSDSNDKRGEYINSLSPSQELATPMVSNECNPSFSIAEQSNVQTVDLIKNENILSESMRGPKRASKIRKLFNLSKEGDVRKYVNTYGRNFTTKAGRLSELRNKNISLV